LPLLSASSLLLLAWKFTSRTFAFKRKSEELIGPVLLRVLFFEPAELVCRLLLPAM